MKKLIYLIAITCSFAVLFNCEKNDYSPAISEIDYVGFEVNATIPVPLNGSITKEVSIYWKFCMRTEL